MNNKEIRAMKKVEGTWYSENNASGFYQWLLEHRGLENADCLKLVSSVYLMEKYAAEQQMPNAKIFDTERYIAHRTMRGLMTSEEFLAYDLQEDERFQTAVELLRQYLRIEWSLTGKDYVEESAATTVLYNENRDVENNASAFYEWLCVNVGDSSASLKHVSSIYSMEKYATQKRMASMQIYGVIKSCAESTIRLLQKDEEFAEYDKQNDKRFSKAADLLMEYLGIRK